MSNDEQSQVAHPSSWRNRIIGSGYMAPGDFLAHPENWRIHSALQEEALEEVLDTVGWVRTVLVNQTTGHVLDGHLRVALGIRRSEPQIPYDLVELTLEEERLVLAALDPIAGMAGTDAAKLKELLDDLTLHEDGSLRQMLAQLEASARSSGSGAGEPVETRQAGAGALAERFGVPPFSVLNAREGWWQDRKAAWISLGIQSELGRGSNLVGRSDAESGAMAGTYARMGGTPGHPPTITQNPDGTPNYGGTKGQAQRFDARRQSAAIPGGKGRTSLVKNSAYKANKQPNATPGGSALPAADYSKSKARGDGRWRKMAKEAK